MGTSQASSAGGSPAPQLELHPQGLCWWCGNPADSREHRYKKTDVVRSFGAGPWSDPVVRVRSGSGYEDRIQGPDSNKLKFNKVLCASCNNTKSQPFDRAYETFAHYLHENEDTIIQTGKVRLSDIYGRYWRERRGELAKYLVKNICCRLAKDGIRTPTTVIDYMNGASHKVAHIRLVMNINMAKYELHQHMESAHGSDDGSLWLGDHATIFNADGSAIGTYSHFGFDWFNVDYEFNLHIRQGTANFLAGNAVRLERFWPAGFKAGDVAKACQDCNPSALFS
ncbi:hypothetical protein ACLQ2E_13710 [Streptomyces lavendulocolor]